MATLIGDKSNEYQTVFSATEFYPELKLSEFQKLFAFLEDTTEFEITNTLLVQREVVHRQLKTLTDTHPSLASRSLELFGSETTGEALYKQAVFSLTAAVLIGNRLATDATKQAADRQEALDQRNDRLRTQYREAVDLLLQTDSGYTIELI